MGTSLKKVGTSNKIGTAAFGIGAVGGLVLAVTGSPVIGIILCIGCAIGAGVCFKNLLKDYAGSGKRF